jgi:predicted Zn-dependent protease
MASYQPTETNRTAMKTNLRSLLSTALLTAGLLTLSAPSFSADVAPTDGVKGVGKKSRALGLASAEEVERQAAQQFEQLKAQARQQQALAPDDFPPLIRLRKIAEKIIPFSTKWNDQAGKWKWEVIMIGSKQVNAFCMPGGKIAFYTGIIDTLKMTDDEIAIVMGHEVAHALREHGRERAGKQKLANGVTIAASVFSAILGYGNVGGQVAQQAASLTLLKYGRDDEIEGDLVGLDLAARAGYDPRAGIKLWEKMAATSKGAPPQWLSTHPSHKTRIDDIRSHLKEVMPLFAKATNRELSEIGPYMSNYGAAIQ